MIEVEFNLINNMAERGLWVPWVTMGLFQVTVLDIQKFQDKPIETYSVYHQDME